MRKLIVTENITVDGVIDLDGRWFAPPESPEDDADVQAANRRHEQTADAVLLGRQTFEDFRGYWPKQTQDQTGITAYLNNVQKYVISSTLTEPDWENTTVLRGPVVEEVEALKAAGGRDIVCAGSVRLVQSLVSTELVDEYRLFVYPVVMGSGSRLFDGAPALPHLELTESETFRSGVVLLSYRAR